MNLQDTICVVTGAASGIGRALCVALKNAGAKTVVCTDLDHQGAQNTANIVNGLSYKLDVREPEKIEALIERIETDVGPIDLFASNAGILVLGGVEVADEDWQRIWEVNLMSHVWAARALIPRMKARGGGYLLNTSSAAGLLNQIGAAPYGVTKHAAVGLAEWLAISHKDDGIKVSVLCPQAVRTEMTRGHEDGVAAMDGMLEPEEAAEACIAAIESETFLVLPHDSVRDYIRLKAENYDRWIRGMTRLHREYGASV